MWRSQSGPSATPPSFVKSTYNLLWRALTAQVFDGPQAHLVLFGLPLSLIIDSPSVSTIGENILLEHVSRDLRCQLFAINQAFDLFLA